MAEQQPEALRLAAICDLGHPLEDDVALMGAELRRLHGAELSRQAAGGVVAEPIGSVCTSNDGGYTQWHFTPTKDAWDIPDRPKYPWTKQFDVYAHPPAAPALVQSDHSGDANKMVQQEGQSGDGVADLDAMRAERDEADRRAGAAERMAERDREAAVARSSWLAKAKDQWGVSYAVSFDVVWAQALAARSERDALLAASQGGDEREPFEAALAKLPAAAQATIRESMKRGESNSWTFFQAGWQAARLPTPPTGEKG